jgi:hypothetical protein
MAKFFVVLAFLVVAAIFCLGVVIAHAGENPFKCTTKSEYEYRKSLPKGTEVRTIGGQAVIKMLKSINAVRFGKDMSILNAQRSLVSTLATNKTKISLFNNGCLVDWGDQELPVPFAAEMLVIMGVKSSDLKSDLGV